MGSVQDLLSTGDACTHTPPAGLDGNQHLGIHQAGQHPVPWADEEGTRAKERYFSPRDKNNDWDFRDQPPELWDQFKTSFPPGTHVRIHPLLDWTEINIWEYIKLDNIPFMRNLYLDQGHGTRYRSLGCAPCTFPIKSTATSVDDILEELRSTKVAERAGRAQDEGRGMELLRKDGYM